MLATSLALALCSPAPQIPLPSQVITSTPPVVAADFGGSTAVHGRTAVVGAPNHQTSSGFRPGAAFVFDRDQVTGQWEGTAALVASNPQQAADFGSAVALFEDTLVIGSPRGSNLGANGAGLAYVFERDPGGAWTERAALGAALPSDSEYFGHSVALEGDRIAVGAYGDTHEGILRAGAVYLFERDEGGPDAWGEVAKLTAPDAAMADWFGYAVALRGDAVLVGSVQDDLGGLANAGSAYLFVRGVGGAWSFAKKLVAAAPQAGASYGSSLTLTEDLAVVGSPFGAQAGAIEEVHVHARDQGGANAWQTLQVLRPGDGVLDSGFGSLVAMEGGTLLVGAPWDDSAAPSAGSAYVFERAPGAALWTEVAKLTGSPFGRRFGSAGGVSAGQLLLGCPEDDLGPDLGNVEALARDPLAGTLYGTDTFLDVLITIDPITGEGTIVGPTGFDSIEGLAFDPLSGTLWGADGWNDQLLAIDPATGAATAVGPFGVGPIRGLAFDPGTGTLYATRSAPGELHRIDLATGAATLIGPTGNGSMRGLTWDPSTGTLYGANPGQNELNVLDPMTGAATQVGTLSPSLPPRGLAFDGPSSILLGAAFSLLVDIDELSGATTEIGVFSNHLSSAGAVYAYDWPSPTATYCTAGVSAGGCLASIASTGAASASSSAGFSLLASGVEGARDGLFFFGANGRQANPWGTGSSYQCVVPPVQRGGVLTGQGTNGLCDGTFAQDLNALWTAKPTKNPGAGALVQAQLWYRDPQSTSNQTTSLSDALEFFLAP